MMLIAEMRNELTQYGARFIGSNKIYTVLYIVRQITIDGNTRYSHSSRVSAENRIFLPKQKAVLLLMSRPGDMVIAPADNARRCA